MAKSDKLITAVTTPKGEALWAKVIEPDTKFNPDGQFEITFAMHEDDPECQKFMARMDQLAQDAYEHETKGMKPGRKKQISVQAPYTKEIDDETGDDTGRILFKIRTRATLTTKTGKTINLSPNIFDAQGKEIKDPELNIGNGSIVRVAFDAVSYIVKDAAGVSRRLKGVQIIDLVSYGNSASSMGFGAEDGGYVAPTTRQFPKDGEDSEDVEEGGGDF